MYCKYVSSLTSKISFKVLIVAKCIVNEDEYFNSGFLVIVLIVAKCIVNSFINVILKILIQSINSSKVYCKF